MGQKVHPVGFRLGIQQKHSSQWFGPYTSRGQYRSTYASMVRQDILIREYLLAENHQAGVSKILIHRRGGGNHIFIDLFVSQPKLVIGTDGNRLVQQSKILKQKILAVSAMADPISKTLIEGSASALSGEDKMSNERTDQLQDQGTNSSFDSSDGKADSEARKSEPEIWIQTHLVPQDELPAKLLALRIAEQLEKRVAFRRVLKQSLQQARTAGLLGIKIQIKGRLNGAEIARTEWVREGRVPLQSLRANIDYATHTAQTIYGVLGIKIWIVPS
jgi:small subunit ribosomal protein S3